jgi:hypothetical protein
MDWAGKITDLFHYESKDAIHQVVQGLRNRYNGEFDAMVLLDQLDQLDQQGQDKRHSLDFYISSSYDRSCHLPARNRFLFLEMLLPNNDDNNCDPTCTLCSTNANARGPSPASRAHSKDPEPRTQDQWYRHRPERQEQRHPH